MNLLLYTNSTGSAEQKIESALKGVSIEHYHRLETFLSRLKQPTFNVTAVVAITDKASLAKLVRHKDLLTHLRTILILPDTDDDTITEAHKLYPRFITYLDDNLNAVAQVLRKMNHHNKGGENG